MTAATKATVRGAAGVSPPGFQHRAHLDGRLVDAIVPIQRNGVRVGDTDECGRFAPSFRSFALDALVPASRHSAFLECITSRLRKLGTLAFSAGRGAMNI